MKVRDLISELQNFDGSMDIECESGCKVYVWKQYRGDSRWRVVISNHPKRRDD